MQLYIRDRVSSVTRPVKELKGFAKVRLEAGETRTVAIEITPASLAFYDIDMNYVVEPGEFEIMVGTSSRDADLADSHPARHTLSRPRTHVRPEREDLGTGEGRLRHR